MESMNQAPFLLRKARFGYRLGNGSWRTRRSSTACGAHRGLPHGHPRRAGGHQGPGLARGPGRVRADVHQNAVAAIDDGRFEAELAPVTVRDAKGRETVVAVDEGPRRDTTAEALARLGPAFDLPDGEDRGSATIGTVTAGNAPGITDGAAATVVASERAVERVRPPAAGPDRRLRAGRGRAEVAVPRAGPGRAQRSSRIELPIDAYDLIEINEAFAAQALADGRELGFDWSKVNVNGGAIALGHPIGASAPGSWRRCSTSSSAAAAATGSRPSAWAAAARSRWRSSGSDRRRNRSGGGFAPRVVGYTRSMTERAVTEPAATGTTIPTYQLFIAGRWVDGVRGDTFDSINPADTRDVVGRFQAGTAADVAMAIRAAETADPHGPRPRHPSAARSCTGSAR